MRQGCINVLIHMLLLLMVACQSNEQIDVNDADYCTVHIVLSTNQIIQPTRSTADNGSSVVVADEQGTPAENYINPYDVSLLVYELAENGGKFVEEAFIHRITPTATKGVYNVEGALMKIPKTYKGAERNFQIIVLCNQRGLLRSNINDLSLANTTVDYLTSNLTFNYDPTFTEKLLEQANESDDMKRTARIPMFGGVQCNLIPQGGSREITGITIPVLRALSKTTVMLDIPESDPLHDDFFIDYITMKKYNTKAFMAGTNPLMTDGSTNFNSKSQTGMSDPHIPAAPGTASDLRFCKIQKTLDGNGNYQLPENSGDRTNCHIIYVPEYDNNGGADDAYMAMRIRTNNYGGSGDGGGLTGVNSDLFYADYTGKSSQTVTANTWDLIRNEAHDYKITKITEEGNMSIVANVPWVVEESEIGWHLDVNAKFDVSNGDAEANYCFMLNPRYEDGNNGGHFALRNASSFASFTFQLTAPEGALWKVHLSNTEDFKLSGGVWTARASDKNFKFDIATKHAWTLDRDPVTGELYPADEFERALTEKGKIWEATGGPETDIYITVTTDGINEREVVINPPGYKDSEGKPGKYKGGRRWPGTDTRVRMKQLKAHYGEGYYEWGELYK